MAVLCLLKTIVPWKPLGPRVCGTRAGPGGREVGLWLKVLAQWGPGPQRRAGQPRRRAGLLGGALVRLRSFAKGVA